MLDLKAIREDPDRFRTALARRNQAESIDRLLELDARKREIGTKVEELRAEQNRASKAIGGAQGDDKQALIDEVAKVSAQIKALEPELEATDGELRDLLAVTPNLPAEDSPDGFTDEDAREVKKVGEPPAFDFEARDHVALGELLGVLDTERGARTSGARFVYLLGPLVMVQWALVRHALDILVVKGFTPVIPPVLVREEAMIGTGFLPDAEGQVYQTVEDDLFLVGTSEVPLAAFHMQEILDEGDLPARYAGYSSCFRREAGSYGKDLGGMFRVHQFDKVEMFSFVTPDASPDEHRYILSVEEEIMGNLEIPYRVVDIAVGDLGGPAAKKFDIEGWLPGQKRYRELTSCSNCTDYQARRLNTRYRTESGNQMVHTLNGTATAVSRTLIAIMENHQRADGSVELPKALHPYLPADLQVMAPVSRGPA